MKTLKGFLYYWLPVILYMAVIFYFSSLEQPIPVGGLEFEKKDLLLHALEYFVLSALLLRAFLYSAVKSPYVYSILFSILYGISDEIHQLFVAGRVFSVQDIMADAVGAFLMLLFFLYEKKVKKKRQI